MSLEEMIYRLEESIRMLEDLEKTNDIQGFIEIVENLFRSKKNTKAIKDWLKSILNVLRVVKRFLRIVSNKSNLPKHAQLIKAIKTVDSKLVYRLIKIGSLIKINDVCLCREDEICAIYTKDNSIVIELKESKWINIVVSWQIPDERINPFIQHIYIEYCSGDRKILYHSGYQNN